MTARQVLDAANNAELGERLQRYETLCGPRGSCWREPLVNDPLRWTFCPDCLTVYDDYGKAINQIPEIYGAASSRARSRSVVVHSASAAVGGSETEFGLPIARFMGRLSGNNGFTLVPIGQFRPEC